jgi:hypothetical protein
MNETIRALIKLQKIKENYNKVAYTQDYHRHKEQLFGDRHFSFIGDKEIKQSYTLWSRDDKSD